MADLLDQLNDWLRIPSISTGDGDPADVRRAAEWVVERVRAAGGSIRAGGDEHANPLAVGELQAATRPARPPS